MKIIKKGTENEVECGCCGSMLEYEPRDVSRTPYNDRDEDGDTVFKYTVRCPVCKHEVHLGSVNRVMRFRIAEVYKAREASDLDI